MSGVKRMNSAIRAFMRGGCVLLMLNVTVAFCEVPSAFIGSWYGEYKEDGTYGGKPYDSFRGAITYGTDGRFEMDQRFYLEDRSQLQTITRGAWGVDGQLLWLECGTMVVRGNEYKCSERQEYSIRETSADKLIYSNNKSKRVHEAVRVPQGFKLP